MNVVEPGQPAAATGREVGEIASERPLVVVQSFANPTPTTNPYIIMLRDSLAEQPDIDLRTFGWRRALASRYDVFHAHWPENLIERRGAATTAVRQLLYLLLLLKIRLTHVALVRTVHNLALPQGQSRRQLLLLRLTERWTTLCITINDSTELGDGRPSEMIRHGHYRDWFARYGAPVTVAGRVTFFGRVRRYKSADRLVKAFHELPSEPVDYSLRIAGYPSSAQLADELRGLAAGDDRIGLHLEFLTDEQLVKEVGEAEVVVLPYAEMHNSGSVLAALSIGRPVLVPDNEVNRRLAEEVGHGWLFRYAGTLTGQHIADAISALRQNGPTVPPDLTSRDWDRVGRDHLAAYRRAVTVATRCRTRRAAPPEVGNTR